MAPTNDLDFLISHYESERSLLKDQIKRQISESLLGRAAEGLQVLYQKDDILRDLRGFTEIETQYLTYLENRQQSSDEHFSSQSKTVNLAGTARQLFESKQMCQICNEGVHSDDLIISCQKCNIQVHRKCYGIENSSTQQWICDLCLYFGAKGRFVRCPLCTRQGGALKATSLLMKDSIFEQSNPSYHQYALANKTDRQSIPFSYLRTSPR